MRHAVAARLLPALLPLLLGATPVPSRTEAPRPDAGQGIFPASEVRPGLTGVARTVFEGNRLEEFGVEILGVLKNAIGPRQDMILARLHGPKVEFTGVVAGMSGSPVYVGGRILGALSYRIGTFAKEPIAGITPIADMLEVAGPWPAARASERPSDPLAWLTAGADRDAPPAAGAPGEARAAAAAGMEPIGTPLVCAGCDPDVLRYYAPAFEVMGLQPAAGGGAEGGDRSTPSLPLEPGTAIGASLATGDLNLSAIGTLTYVQGDRVFAFGHPMSGLGSVEVPMTQAQVVATLASEAGSFKIANATAPIGTVSQDRLTAIMGEVGRTPPTLPLDVRVHGPGGVRAFHYDVVQDRTWSPLVVALTAANSLVRTTQFESSASVSLRCRIAIDGQPTVTYQDLYAGTRPNAPVHVQAANDVGALVALLANNPFEATVVRSAEADFEILDSSRVASVDAVSAAPSEVRPGDVLHVTAVLTRFRGPARTVRLDVPIPEDTPPGDLTVLVGGGSAMDLLDRRVQQRQLAQAANLGDLIRIISRQRKSGALYVRLTRKVPSAIVRTDLLPDLPLSIFNVLNNPRLSADTTLLLEAPVAEMSRDLDVVVAGGRRLSLKVR